MPRSRIYINGRRYCYTGMTRDCYYAQFDAPSEADAELEGDTNRINRVLNEAMEKYSDGNREVAILVVPGEDRPGGDDGLQLAFVYTDLEIHR